MRITFTFDVRFFDVVSGAQSSAPTVVDDIKVAEDALGSYCDPEIADEGIVGGEVRLTLMNQQPTLAVDYWSPGRPSEKTIDTLQAYTIAQLEDGLGEGGFTCDLDGERLLAVADTDGLQGVDVLDDGRSVLGPHRVAIAARDGNRVLLSKEIIADPEAINRLHQGCTALHLAIIYGHLEAIKILLAAGADPNAIDVQGITPLEACALSNSLGDEESRVVGQLLLDAGSSPEHCDAVGESAKTFAESRGKLMLASIL